MIPITYIGPLLRHFDAIDRVATAGLTNISPDTEPTITQNLCKVLDMHEQHQTVLDYPLSSLLRDLASTNGITNAKLEFKTYYYNSAVENRVTQSDIGLIINYRDFIVREASWSESWLLQAKSLKPISKSPPVYTEHSAFDALSTNQLERIEELQKIANIDFVRIMNYCPRLATVQSGVRAKLLHFRNMKISGDIFDYALGLELRQRLLNSCPTLEPGIFISTVDPAVTRFNELYQSFFLTAFPFSLFILRRLFIVTALSMVT